MADIVMSQEEIKRILPHRDPMLLVDQVLQLSPMESAETTFYVRPDWDIFRGHFPGDPVLPGVLSVECIAQAADVMIMTAEQYAGKTPLFAGIDKTRFRRKISPGDTVVSKVRVSSVNQERGLIICSGQLFLGEELAVSAEITVAMR